MQAGDWQRLSALFDELAELPADERATRLAAVRPPELASRLARMLASLPDGEDTVLAALPGFDAHLAQALAEPEGLPPQAGDRFGAWCLAELLGEGGMGQVWRAERADGLYQGEAAIKLLRNDLATPGLAARFARERTLLGRLTHRGIARLLDAGEQNGRAFLVLEYVAGRTLSEHVRALALPLAARVKLLVDVARAVEHAHAQLIVHRDLKPSNVMLDEVGATKLLDFGIAGLLDDSGQQADHQLTLVAGRRLTPAYAAPEQITGEPVGAATDIYSLGVMLYELASGELPFGRRGLSRTALEHAVLHGQARRIARTTDGVEGSGEAGPGRPVDAHRARGDLEAVAAKAMRRDPAERYASVGSFVDDLERWLARRPVSVRAEDWRHRAHLWLRRNTALAAGATLVFAALSAGLAVSLWQRGEAQAAARESEQVTGYLAELLSAASPDRNGGRQPTVVELLDRKRQELATRFNDQPEVKDRIFDTLTKTYFALQRFDVAAPLAEQRLAHARQSFGDEDTRTEDAAVSLAGIHTAVAGGQPIIDLLEPLLRRWDARYGPLSEKSHGLRLHLLTAYGRLGRFADAERELALARRSNDAIHANNPFEHARFATYENVLYVYEGRLHDAERSLERARPFWNAREPERMRPALVLERNLAFVRWRLARESAAEATARSDDLIRRWDAVARPGNHASTLMRQMLGAYLQQLGEFGPALEQVQRAQADTEAAGADDAVTGLLRRMLVLEARALAEGRVDAATVDTAAQALASLDAAPLIGDVRRAEGLLTLVRVAIAPGAGAAGQALAREIDTRLDKMRPQLDQARNLVTRIDLLKARVAGTPAAWLAATRQRTAYFDGLPEPQGLPEWVARLQLACALRAAGEPWQDALARAETARPPGLAALTPAPHPLTGVTAHMAAGTLAPDCDWRF
ncbi:protein kinase domain-containing protein [Roseateles sp.]|uniref:serine/threonine-protein kinase n=1 Tax=Roseateles sp. TaxID=1971397 RepID=UPI0039E81E2F